MKGWHNDRLRHSLARKGIKTGCTKKLRRCVIKVKKKELNVNPYAVCRASIYGKNKR